MSAEPNSLMVKTPPRLRHGMPGVPTQPARRRRLPATLAWWACGLAAAGVALCAVGWQAAQRSGRTPAELLDYADRRMEGHPKVQWLAWPLVNVLRQAFDAPSLQERLALPFEIPPPPPRRGPADVHQPEPAPVGAKVWRVGPGGPLARIADAARLAKDGDVVEIEAGDYHGDVASWHQKRLTIRGVNGAARLFAAGRNAEGKAIWVFKQGDFDIANIDFVGARAGDGNGAGIRLERGRLRIRSCLFWDNQMGLITAGLPFASSTAVDIEGSEFAYSHVQGRWGHNLYVGAIDRLRVVGSYFHHASRGHLLKSRAAVNEVLYNRLTDESGGRASYEVDFPNGGQVLLVGNVIQQQRDTENGIMVSYGEEGYRWPRNTLLMASNTLVNDHPHGGAFLRVARGAQRVVASNNLLVGIGRYLVDDELSIDNDQRADWADLAQPSRHDYRVRADAGRFRFRPSPASVSEPGALPQAQYVHPRRLVPMTVAPGVVGADQRPVP